MYTILSVVEIHHENFNSITS